MLLSILASGKFVEDSRLISKKYNSIKDTELE